MLSGAFSSCAVDREDVVADAHVDARRGERRAQVGIPALVVVDLRDPVSAVLDREVGAEQAAGHGCGTSGMSPPRTYECPIAISAPIMSRR